VQQQISQQLLQYPPKHKRGVYKPTTTTAFPVLQPQLSPTAAPTTTTTTTTITTPITAVPLPQQPTSLLDTTTSTTTTTTATTTENNSMSTTMGIDFEEVVNMYNKICGGVEDPRCSNGDDVTTIPQVANAQNQDDLNLFNYSVEVNDTNHFNPPDDADSNETYGSIMPSPRYVNHKRVLTVQEKRDMLLMLQGAMERGLITEEQFRQKRGEFLMSIRF